jgi:alpha-1,6-mannosyltransferase
MRQDSSSGEPSVALRGPRRARAVAAAGQPDGALAIPRLGAAGQGLNLAAVGAKLLPWLGAFALLTLVALAFAVVAFAATAPSLLVPRSTTSFPDWFAGPLHGVFAGLTSDPLTLGDGFSVAVGAMALAYCLAIATARTLPLRAIAVCVVALHAILLLSPPLRMEDMFDYIGYARLGALHSLNPYTHVVFDAAHDPVFRFTGWHHLTSPYGPLFTAITYPLAFLPLPVSYWVLKIATVLASLGFLALVCRCARLLGRDQRFVLVFVAANPIFLIFMLGGFHNDVFMLVPSTAAIALMLEGRDRAAGAALVVAVAIKFTAVLLLPFLLVGLVGAAASRRRIELLKGFALTAIPLLILSLVLFGPALPNLKQQSSLLTSLSVPTLVGNLIGAGGGAPWLLHLADVGVVATVLYMLVRRRHDWLAGAGWSTFALVLSLGWLVPWYVVWVLPLAALGTSAWLRRWTLALTAFLIVTFVPLTDIVLNDLRVDPMSGPAGLRSLTLQRALER